MKQYKVPLMLTLFCLLCSGRAIGQNAVALTNDQPASKAAVVLNKESSGPDARIREMEEKLIEMQEAIGKLKAEVDRLRSEHDGRTDARAEVSAPAQPGPAASLTASNAETVSKKEEQSKTDKDPQDKRNLLETVLPGVKLSGSALLYAYSPAGVPGARPFFDLYGAWLNLDREGEGNGLGFHIEFRYRSTKFRTFFDGPSWVQEAYVKAKVPGGTVKIGRIYKQLGIFSDYSFFGDLAYFDGLKYNPEWGVSYEGSNKLNDRVSFDHYVQLFRSDGRTNGSFPGRDVVSDPNSQRRNEIVLRGVPRFKLGEKASLAVGGTFERGHVARPLESDNNVYRRVAGEASLSIGPATIFSEVIRQSFDGTRFPDLPNVTYTNVGGNYDLKLFSIHVVPHGQKLDFQLYLGCAFERLSENL